LILRNQAEALERAIYNVLPGATSRKVFVVEGDQLVPYEEQGGQLPTQDAIFAGYEESGDLVGYGIPAAGAGFQDTIRLIYGYDPEADHVVGMEVLESRETPGLGDKIIKDQDFLANFKALEVKPEIVSVPAGSKAAANEVDSISGATISSKAVVNIINSGNSRWLPLIEEEEKTKEQQQ
jgi:electron transport complex protein RnfG